MRAVSASTLLQCSTAPGSPVLIDVRRQGARLASGQTIDSAIWRDPAQWLDWKDEVAALAGPLVFFCVHGHEISQGLTAALCAMGKDAAYLEGGFSQWLGAGMPVATIATAAPPDRD